MPTDLPQFPAHDVWRKHQTVTATDTFFAHPVFHRLADQPALGMPEDQPRARDLLYRKQVQLFAQHAMVARLDLFQPLEVRIQVLRVEKRRPIDPLQLLVMLVAQPVRARDRCNLVRLHPSRRTEYAARGKNP